MSKKIAIVGTGLIGRSWSIVFARAGFEVWLLGSCGGCRLTAIKLIKEGLPSLAEENLLNGCSVEQVFGRVHASDSLEDALDGADHLQENAPERVGLKGTLSPNRPASGAPNRHGQFDLWHCCFLFHREHSIQRTMLGRSSY